MNQNVVTKVSERKQIVFHWMSIGCLYTWGMHTCNYRPQSSTNHNLTF